MSVSEFVDIETGAILDNNSGTEDKRLRDLLNPFEEGGWKNTMKLVMAEIKKKPGWLIDRSKLTYRAWTVDSLSRLDVGLSKLDDFNHHDGHWQGEDCAYVLRFRDFQRCLTIYVWRRGYG
jgi:hypothetical protein